MITRASLLSAFQKRLLLLLLLLTSEQAERTNNLEEAALSGKELGSGRKLLPQGILD